MKKLYYSISEISEILQEEQHILRYWEKEFEMISPRKNRGGNRIYSPDDLELLKIIKQLIRQNNCSVKQTKDIFERYQTKAKILQNKISILANKIEGKNNNKSNGKFHNSHFHSLSNSDKVEITRMMDEVISLVNRY
jgi:DNA-binding transcriptional MerR regulator